MNIATENLDNDLLLRTIRKEKVERPPVWLMRQAGRILPQYRAIRSSLDGFISLVTNPKLAAEVTIQPVDELGVDAAIIFSDILVIPEAMGLPYEMISKRGPYFPKTIESMADIANLSSGHAAAERLGYVYEAIEETKKGLAGRVPLIGFAGAPWTLMSYMIEGQGSKTFSKAKAFLYQHPKESELLLDRLTETIIAFLKLKIKSGVNMVQIFDSWSGVLDKSLYQKYMIPRLRQIREAITEVPVVIFSKGAWFALEDIATIKPDVIGLDWNTEASVARALIGHDQVVQGNLDPCKLYASEEEVSQYAIKMIEQFGKHHIVNLGHGVYPDTPLKSVKAFVNTVKEYKY